MTAVKANGSEGKSGNGDDGSARGWCEFAPKEDFSQKRLLAHKPGSRVVKVTGALAVGDHYLCNFFGRFFEKKKIEIGGLRCKQK